MHRYYIVDAVTKEAVVVDPADPHVVNAVAVAQVQ
jgi:hypothetical protein